MQYVDESGWDLVVESLKNDLATVSKPLREISRRVIAEGISEYPLFIASRDFVEIGKLIFDRDEVQLNWFFYASVLEEFVRKKLVLPENVQAFARTFGDPEEKACIFVIYEGDARFVFVPFSGND
jgi:hypothetical protein